MSIRALVDGGGVRVADEEQVDCARANRVEGARTDPSCKAI